MSGRILKLRMTEDDIVFDLDRDAQVLSVGLQNDEIVLWVIDPDKPAYMQSYTDYPSQRRFRAINTGQHTEDDYVYIGSVTTSNVIVWHIFEVV